MEGEVEDIYRELLQVEEPVGQARWSSFLFNIELARKLEGLSQEQATLLCQQGHKWQGTGWTTARASRELHAVTGVPLVASQITSYRDAWLFALAMWFEVEVVGLDLTDRSSEAAFALCQCLCQFGPPGADWVGAGPAGAQAATAPGPPPQQEDDEEPETKLSWDEEPVELPPELQVIWSGVKAQTRKLDLKTILDTLPKFNNLPSKAPENNHRLDSKKDQDRVAKAWSQGVLHSLRFQAHIYQLMLAGAEPLLVKQLFEQNFQLSAELFVKMCNHRKELSIPGSVVVTQEVLFDKESLGLAQAQSKINRAFFPRGMMAPLFSQKIITPLFSSGKSFGKASSSKGRFGFRGSGPYFSGRGQGVPSSAEQGAQTFSSTSGSTSYFGGFRSQGGKSYGRGKGRGMFPHQGGNFSSSSSQVEGPSGVVAGEFDKRSVEFNSRWGGSPMGPRLWAQLAPALCRKVPPSGTISLGFTPRVLGHWGRGGTGVSSIAVSASVPGSVGGTPFSPMVCHLQGGRDISKTSSHYRLSKSESVFAGTSLQNGPLGSNFSFCSQGHVGLQSGLETRLFSPASGKKFAGISGFAGERKIFSVSGSPVRSKPFTFLVDPSDENFGQGLETKGYQQFCVPGRRFGVGKKSKQVGKGHGLRPGHFSPVGSSNKLQEKCSATNPKSATFGFPFGLGKRPPPSAGGKTFLHEKGVETIRQQKNF